MTDTVRASVQTVSPISGRVRRVVLLLPTDYRWRAGQYLGVRLEDKEAYYSIASADSGDGRLELAVGESPEAASFAPRAEARVTRPMGQAALPDAVRGKQFCFVAMGTGIAPLRAAVQELTSREWGLGLTLLHGARTEADCLFSGEFEALAESRLLDYRPVVSRPSAAWQGRVGRVQGHLAELPRGVHHYGVCGSRQMVDDVADRLRRAGAESVFAQGY
jgi:NAD(P)H-flavin reductase